MESKTAAVNIYTSEEISELLRTVETMNFYNVLHYYEREIFIYVGDFASYINNMPLGVESLGIKDFLKKMYIFLHETPIEDVPLFVNKFPELANWRLALGK